MKPNKFGITALVAAGMAVFPTLSMAAAPKTCNAGKPTPESYTWNFKEEASQLLDGIQKDAAKAEDHADKLARFAMTPALSWQTHATELQALKTEVNDMGGKLCRLQTIRHMLDPWQRKAIDRVMPLARLTAGNVENAIEFLNRRQSGFWAPEYRGYIDSIYAETGRISSSVERFQEYAKVRKEYLNLREDLGMRAGS